MLHTKRGSIFLIVFFIAIVMVIFFMIAQQGRVPTIGAQTATQSERTFNYAEILKRFTFITAEESLTKASYDAAKELSGYPVIYDSKPQPFELQTVNPLVSSKSKDYLNSYLSLLDGQEFGNVKFEDTTSVDMVDIKVTDIDIVEKTVFSNFGASFTGSGTNRITSTQTGEQNEFGHEYNVMTQCDRFYYLIDGFNQWATTNVLSAQSCGSIPAVVAKGSGDLHYPSINFANTIQPVVEDAISDLQERFDDDVHCTFTIRRYIAKTNPIPVGTRDPCPVGDGKIMCGEGCPVGEPIYKTDSSDCVGEKSSVIYQGGTWHPPGAVEHMGCGSVGVHHELLIDLEVSCTDYKCKNPVSAQGMEYLTMNVTAYVHLIHHRDPEPLECEAPGPCGPPPTTPDQNSQPEPDRKSPPPARGDPGVHRK